MSQIKDTASGVSNDSLDSFRPSDEISIDARISGLLATRTRLLRELTRVDRRLAELRVEAAARTQDGAGDGGLRWFPVLGEQLASGRFALPPGLDAADLGRRAVEVLAEEKRQGRQPEGLEFLIAFRPESGRVLSVRTRRPGGGPWIRRFESVTPVPGH